MKLSLQFVGAALTLLMAVGCSRPTAENPVAWDEASHILTLRGKRYEMKVSADHRVIVTSFRVDGREVLGASGIYSGVKAGENWTTSEKLPSSPEVRIDGDRAILTYQTPDFEERWTLTANADRATLRIARKYPAGLTAGEIGQPVLNFKQDAVEHVRWAGDGGNWPVSGPEADHIPKTWFSMASPGFEKKRHTKQQLGFTLLSPSRELALRIEGSSSFSDRERGEASVVQRMADGQLRFSMEVAEDGLRYADVAFGKETLPYMRDGNPNGIWPWKPVAIPAGSKIWTELAFVPDDFLPYSEIGEIQGLDGKKLGAFVNDYARFMMVDRAHGGYVEHIGAMAELIPCQYHWLTQLVDTFQHEKNQPVHAFQGGLNDIRDHASDPVTGHVWNFTSDGSKWGNNNLDNEPGYVLGVCNIFNLSGDEKWLKTHRDSVRRALAFSLKNNMHPETRLATVARSSHAPEIHSNDYMENAWWQGWPGAGPDGPQNSDACLGGPHGTASAMFYNALTRWANLEEQVFQDKEKAAEYRSISGTLQENFLKAREEGGCWLPEIDAIALSTTTAPVRYMPAIAEALKGDLLPPDKARAASRGYLDELLASKETSMLVQNLYDLGDASRLSDYTHIGTDGGFYGCTGGDAYATFVSAGYRDAMLQFTNHWLAKDTKDWFRSEGYLLRDSSPTDNHLPDRPKCWMVFPSTAGVAWGLQHYGFGFQPQHDRLIIAPFIAKAMIGSRVPYMFRGVRFEVEYAGLHKFRVDYPAEPKAANVVVRFVNQTPGRSGYEVKINSRVQTVTADARGNVDVAISPGASTVELINSDPEA
jgi:hypothetical protein